MEYLDLSKKITIEIETPQMLWWFLNYLESNHTNIRWGAGQRPTKWFPFCRTQVYTIQDTRLYISGNSLLAEGISDLEWEEERRLIEEENDYDN